MVRRPASGPDPRLPDRRRFFGYGRTFRALSRDGDGGPGEIVACEIHCLIGKTEQLPTCLKLVEEFLDHPDIVHDPFGHFDA